MKTKKKILPLRNSQDRYQRELMSRIGIFVAILFFLITIPYLMFITSKPQSIPRSKAVTCNDSNCANVYISSYNMYQITNCYATNDPDGDQQLCNVKGRIGLCRNQQYCCPGVGMQWTTNMSSCATPSPTRSPTSTVTPTATKTPTYTPTRTPTQTPTTRPLATKSPTPIVKSSCNGSCTTNTNCTSGLVCAAFTDGSRRCRNSKCLSASSCVCPTTVPTLSNAPYPTGVVSPTLTPYPTYYYSGSDLLFTSPTPTMNPTPAQLAVNTFTDSKNQTDSTFTLTGSATPYAEVDIKIPESNVSYTTVADEKGYWRYIITKNLVPGKNTLYLTARLPNGTKADMKQEFTVVNKRSSTGLIVFGVIILLGGIGYIFYRQQQ